MTLDIGSFEKAIASLTAGLARYELNTADDQIRDGLIQRFEFTFELSHKTLKRYMESAAASPREYDGMPFQDLIRSGNEQGVLLGDWPTWKKYRDMRSKTSHVYDESKALEVVAGIPAFLAEAVFLRDQIRRRLA